MKQWRQRHGEKSKADNVGMSQTHQASNPGIKGWSWYKELLETIKGGTRGEWMTEEIIP